MRFEIIKTIIDKWDPMELLSHAPKDEYDKESLQIFQYYTNNIEELGKIIFDIFQKAFDDSFAKDLQECVDVANSIVYHCGTMSSK